MPRTSGHIDLNNDFIVSYAGITDPGVCRTHNEDFFGILPGKFLFCIADGVGGMDAGEVASHAAIQCLLESDGDSSRYGLTDLFGRLAWRGRNGSSTLSKLIERVGKHVYDLSEKLARKMATTIVALRIMPDRTAEVGNIGDSRAYLYRGNILGQISDDHSVTNELLRAGLPIRLDAGISNLHKITKALGCQKNVVTPDIFTISFHENDLFLLCSDGLTDMVTDVDISSIMAKYQKNSLSRLLDVLIERAIQSGGRDNITVVAVRVERKNI